MTTAPRGSFVVGLAIRCISSLSFTLHLSIMSFFKRSDPNAPAARRAAQGSPAPYQRVPDNASYSSLPPPTQQVPPLRQSPLPSQDPYGRASGIGGGYGAPAQQVAQPTHPNLGPRGASHYSEKSQNEYGYQSQPQKGYPQLSQGGTGRGV